MEKEIYIVIYLEDGYYIGVDEVFDNLNEAKQFVEGFNEFVLANNNEFPDYGTIDYIRKDNPGNRLVIQKEVVFIS